MKHNSGKPGISLAVNHCLAGNLTVVFISIIQGIIQFFTVFQCCIIIIQCRCRFCQILIALGKFLPGKGIICSLCIFFVYFGSFLKEFRGSLIFPFFFLF